MGSSGHANVDAAKDCFDDLAPRWLANREQIETEQDARLQIINRMLTEVLGWDWEEIKTEPHGDSGYADYLVSAMGRAQLVIEAKKAGRILIDTKTPRVSRYKVGGPALKSAREGIDQARGYCLDSGVLYATLTSGFEWIAFSAVRSDGQPYTEGTAIAFPSLEAISESFAEFYDLFSKEGVQQQLHRARLQEAEGLHVRSAESWDSISKSTDVRLLEKSDIASDLDRVFAEFFSTMSGDDDPDMLAKCFVESKESKEADANLEKITRNLVSRVRVVDAKKGKELEEHLKVAIEARRGDFVLIIGNKGAGKSTFIDRFFKLVLTPQLREKCLLARIDIADSSGDVATVTTWLIHRLKNRLEEELFSGATPSFDQLQGVFFKEYRRWSNGEFKHLYDTDKDAFRIKFGQYIHDLVENKPELYVRRLLQDAIRARGLLPCIIFDNADHFPQAYQEQVFQYAQSVFRSVLSFIICPITDRTIWQLSKEGPFQSYPTTTFYLPVPSTKAVLERRIEFLKNKVAESPTIGAEYFSTRGIRLKISDLDAFALVLEDVLINTEYLGRLIGWLSNHDIRRGLHIAQRVVTSPILSIDQLVVLYVGGQRRSIDDWKIRRALIQGDYSGFRQADSDYILNLFSVPVKHVTTPLAKLSILRLLNDRENEATAAADRGSAAEHSYLFLREVIDYLEIAGISSAAILEICGELLRYRLVEPYDPSDQGVYVDQRVRITHSGKIHLELALEDETYAVQMALHTKIHRGNIVARGREIYYGSGKLDRENWLDLLRLFYNYCLNDDEVYVELPLLTSYQGQRDIRTRLRARWVDSKVKKKPELEPKQRSGRRTPWGRGRD